MFSRFLLVAVSVALPAFGQTTFSVMVNGTSYQVDRYTPPGTGPFPVVALGHGFSNNKSNVRGLAEALLADGAVVVAPQFPFGSGDHARNATVMLAAIDATVSAGLGDAQRIGVGGHSAGALSAWLAAAQRSTVRAVVLLDPVDSGNAGGAATVTAPTLFAFAPPQSCNMSNNSVGWFTTKAGAKGRFNVPMANHCDPQEPSSALCTGGCGPSIISPATWNMARSLVYKRYARAFFGQFLLGSTTCVETMAANDSAIDQVSMSLGCSSGAGGGAAGGAPTSGGAAGGATSGGAAGGATSGGTAGGTSGGAAGGAPLAGGAAGGNATAGGEAGGASGGAAGGMTAGSSAAGGTSGGSAGGASGTSGGTAGAAGGTGGAGPAVCNAANCTGCCNGNVCVVATTEASCGASGLQCAVCRADQLCTAGRCEAPPPGCGCQSSPWAVVGVVALGVWARRRRAPVA